MQNQVPPTPQQNPYPPQSQQPVQYQVSPPADGFAITSMVLGILAVITCYLGIILGTVAVIFGHISLGKMKKDPKLGGKGMAIAGLATGYVAIAVSVVFGITVLFAANTAGQAGKGFFDAFEAQVEQQRVEAEEQMRLEKERQEKEDSRELIPIPQ